MDVGILCLTSQIHGCFLTHVSCLSNEWFQKSYFQSLRMRQWSILLGLHLLQFLLQSTNNVSSFSWFIGLISGRGGAGIISRRTTCSIYCLTHMRATFVYWQQFGHIPVLFRPYLFIPSLLRSGSAFSCLFIIPGEFKRFIICSRKIMYQWIIITRGVLGACLFLFFSASWRVRLPNRDFCFFSVLPNEFLKLLFYTWQTPFLPSLLIHNSKSFPRFFWFQITSTENTR
jgi:hypothetical protein